MKVLFYLAIVVRCPQTTPNMVCSRVSHKPLVACAQAVVVRAALPEAELIKDLLNTEPAAAQGPGAATGAEMRFKESNKPASKLQTLSSSSDTKVKSPTTMSSTTVITGSKLPEPQAAPQPKQRVSSSKGNQETLKIAMEIKKLQAKERELTRSIKEAKACARRLPEQKIEFQELNEELAHYQKEKEREQLATKIQAQVKDLKAVESMSRALRQKYQEMKRTKMLIRAQMSGTQGSLGNLDRENGKLFA